MDIIRLANEAEIEQVKTTSDLSYATSVLTFGGKDFAVVRNCFEIDPVIFASDTNVRRMQLFLMNLETAFRLQGVKEFYFNVKADDEQYLQVLDTWGATKISSTPEFRYKKEL